jgi:peptidoglycan/LPS O-acetylase OafA/YrhL
MRFLNLRPVKFVGTLSYSLYLIHHVVVEAVLQRLAAPLVVTAAVSLAISVALATLVWYFIEEPCAVVRRRLTATPGAKPARVAPEVTAR